jgi:hypothetical protein
MRLGYSLIFEKSSAQINQLKDIEASPLQTGGKETPLLNKSFVPPGHWMGDLTSSASEKDSKLFQKKSDKNKDN